MDQRNRHEPQPAHRSSGGSNFRLYRTLGAHRFESDGADRVRFAVWAPNAEWVSVIGDFNGWAAESNPLAPSDDGSGIWTGFVAGARHGACYKYRIKPRAGPSVDKADPYALACESPPASASRVWFSRYQWGDAQWMQRRGASMSPAAPWSIYELHLGSWRRDPAAPARLLGYRELAALLPAYVAEMGFTHVGLLPLTEHADYGSWGYPSTGFFAPSARYGSPDDLRALIDALHRHDIGVLLDWSPATFATEGHGLVLFDGTRLYETDGPAEEADPRLATRRFDHRREEVRGFVGSSALHWLDEFHVDGLRYVGLPSLLRDQQGRDDQHGASLLRALNDAIRSECPGARTIADDTTSASGVSRPTHDGGLGCDLAWNAGQVRDALRYVALDPVHRKHHHALVAVDLRAGANARCVLPLSHDEVAQGRGSLIGRLPGDDWQRFATLRLLYGYLWAMPGKKLLFMGDEFAQWRDWQPDISLDWNLLDDERHRQTRLWVGDLNRLLRSQPALHRLDFEPEGAAWLARDEAELSLLALERSCPGTHAPLVIICNFTPVVRENFRVGVATSGYWRESINSDAQVYGGSGRGNLGGVDAAPVAANDRFQSIVVTLPPLAMIVLERTSDDVLARSAHERA